MSIASRIESIEEHIGNAYDSIEALGVDITDIDKNIENISSSIDGIYDTLPKVTDEGESITLDGTIKGRLKTTLKGNTSQNGTPTPDTPIPVNVVSGDNEIIINGKNLLNMEDVATSNHNGLDIGIQNNELSINGTATISFGITITNLKNDLVLENETNYTFSKVYSGTVDGGWNFQIRNANDTNVISTNPYNYPQKFNTFDGIGKTIRLYFAGGRKFTNYKIKIQIEKGSTNTTYEPYTGATYPINLPVENLFDKDTATFVNNKVKNDNGIEGTYNGLGYTSSYIPVQPNTTYTLKGSLVGSARQTRVYYYNSSKTWISRSDGFGNGVNTCIFTTSSNCNYIQFQYEVSVLDSSTIQVNKGNPTTNYYPYGTTPIELCNMPNTDYEDTFIHDKTLDKWYKYGLIKKDILNNQTWSLNGGSGSVKAYTINLSDAKSVENTNTENLVLCTRLKGDNANYLIGHFVEYLCAIISNKRLYAMFDTTSFPDSASIKTYFTNNNATLYYVLETPTTTEITYQPLIDQLNAIEKAMSKDGQTNISQVNNDLPFIISASALKEWQESTSLNSTLSMVNPLSLGNTLNTQEIKNNTQPIEVDNIEPLEEGEYE